jgi:hypothetical protein
MKRLLSTARLLLLLVCGLSILGFSGCATNDDGDNASVRPWNAPKNWEGGLPSGLMEGR